jgi:NAD(P)-dependent dehydrogenase (short-subunit alcohol dehydrogenase family)
MRLDGAVVLVTGANRGIGAALVRALLERGAAKVYATGRRPENVATGDPRVVPLRLDVTDPESVTAAAAAARDVTVLINNAGRGVATPLIEGTLDDARAVMEIHYFGTWSVSRAFAPVLASNGGGALVNILSTAGWKATSLLSGYSASKAAEWSLTNALRLGLKEQGTHVVGIVCGYVDTEMTAWANVPKITADTVAEETLRAVETGADEALLDDFTRNVKSALSGDVVRLHQISPEFADLPQN